MGEQNQLSGDCVFFLLE